MEPNNYYYIRKVYTLALVFVLFCFSGSNTEMNNSNYILPLEDLRVVKQEDFMVRKVSSIFDCEYQKLEEKKIEIKKEIKIEVKKDSSRVIAKAKRKEKNTKVDSIRFTEAFMLTVEFIKKHEGFAGGKLYYCVAGYPTIGYGHVVQPHEHFPGNQISKSQAEKLLISDLLKSVARAREYVSVPLNDYQLMAVAHFIFAKGPGRYQKSRLRKMINNNQCPDQEFLQWCYYHTPEGKKVRSQYSYNIRKWEVNMFNKKDSAFVSMVDNNHEIM